MARRKALALIRKFLKIVDKQGIRYETVLLFGSHARGEARPQSDVDLCFVFSRRTRPRVLALQDDLRMLAARNGFNFDIIATSLGEFRNNRVSPILHEIRKDGVVVG